MDFYTKYKVIRSHFGGRIAVRGAKERIMGNINSGATVRVRRGGSSWWRGGQGSVRQQ